MAGESSLNAGIWGRFTRWISQTMDEGVGTSFDQHVIAGYRFIMRYYTDKCDVNDKIYIFGFSRGAFTARFLARMISEIGLLSKGNEEMVPFAYKAYQNSQMTASREFHEKSKTFMENFKTTFCRSAKVHFLGLFDTVNSVGVFDVPFTRNLELPTVRETADHVRHAVSIDERRAKFKAALLAQDRKDDDDKKAVTEIPEEDVKEVYFAGNHGDVGGGWGPVGKERTKNYPTLEEVHLTKKTYGAETLTEKDRLEANDPVQLSDIALEWMITELEMLAKSSHKHGKAKGDETVDKAKKEKTDKADRIAWNYHKKIFLYNYYSKVKDAVTAPQHDMLKWGCGSSWYMFIMWKLLGKMEEHCSFYSASLLALLTQNLLELLPFDRLELINRKWVTVRWPPNNSNTRDIPITGVYFHPSVHARLRTGYTSLNDPTTTTRYHPNNTAEDHTIAMLHSDAWKSQAWYRNDDKISKKLKKVEGNPFLDDCHTHNGH